MKTTEESYWYLATVYSKHPDGLAAAFVDACRIAAKFVEAGVRVHSPIAHTHSIAFYGGLDPLDHEIWLPADQPFMDHACGIIVCRMPGWEESKGIAHEIEAFRAAGKPVLFYDP